MFILTLVGVCNNVAVSLNVERRTNGVDGRLFTRLLFFFKKNVFGNFAIKGNINTFTWDSTGIEIIDPELVHNNY
jgi:hypothetical protein